MREYTTNEALDIYKKLVLIRQCQEKIISEYHHDEIKTPVHLDIGLEGISVGLTHLLSEGDKVFGTFRNHGLYLSLTQETDKYFAELYGKVTGTGHGKAGSMHLTSPEHGLIATSGVVASTVSQAVGAALANQYQKNDNLVVVVFGDSVLEAGEFWESLNFACLHNLRILFACADNGLAAQTPGEERQGFRSFQHAVEGFKCHTRHSVDGSDVLAVLGAFQGIRERIDDIWSPGFLHLPHLRFREHVGPGTDFHQGYRVKPKDIYSYDPVFKYENYLIYDRNIPFCSLREFQEQIAVQIDNSVAAAKTAPFPSVENLLHGVYAT